MYNQCPYKRNKPRLHHEICLSYGCWECLDNNNNTTPGRANEIIASIKGSDDIIGILDVLDKETMGQLVEIGELVGVNGIEEKDKLVVGIVEKIMEGGG